MIPANELRIGNWVETYNFSDIEPYQESQVKGIHPDGRLYLEINGQPGYYWLLTENERGTEINPIPLTPEILESCSPNQIWFADNFNLTIKPTGVLLKQKNEGVKYLTYIKYVHQLQNLFFALTGVELTVNLTEL